MSYYAGTIDVAVIGAGHAGIEAALAASRLGLQTVIFTTNLDAVGNMPCNPSIGGTGKGHLVFEIDALGGEMGYAADQVTLQSRTLNLGKGPAVHSKRVQADRILYRNYMKKVMENTKNLTLRQAEIVDIRFEEENGKKRVRSVVTSLGAEWECRAAIIAAGTFLSSRTITGEAITESGPDAMLAAGKLSASLRREGISLLRFKTGTPPRIHADSIDYSVLERQDGEELVTPFSARTAEQAFVSGGQLPCYIAYTNEKTHAIIRENIHRSPLYSGVIEGVGPRYCPSIEDKVMRFADKHRHQLFVEPCGADTKEIYLQGFSSSLPEEVQIAMLHSIKGFENAVTMRSAYAIEYDCADPLQLRATLEFKDFKGLYGAGQFNGSSGYEEAAAQGLVAGINAALAIKGEEPMVLPRNSSYIGTLIDDLVTKGTNEPYRIMTSRSEYRLLLRQDNADARLTPIGRRVGLIDDARFSAYEAKQKHIADEIERCEHTFLPPSDALNGIMQESGLPAVTTGISLAELLRRPTITYQVLAAVDPSRPELTHAECYAVEVAIKYEGYIKRQLAEVKRREKLDETKIPEDFDYDKIPSLRIEARQKLKAIRPMDIGAASRISGVSPADISVLLIYLTK
ncbi:MAG: tRNA uridine-5-carboxymethylaminomethyl(34) synthesis enzyme MnmG [Clostridia bacterium]|nr:tRNA uridine-5-carboxymethylaminomethyl(34) synthesis enzyme MnmG [Clostridia bacterium]